ncbi:MAG: heavy-metal-associated domain-containing protein [Myxococcota bacterium]
MAEMVKFYVSGMSCDGCATSVQKMLSDGLDVAKDDVEVDLKGESAVVRVDTKLGEDDEKVGDTLYKLRREGFPTQIVG